MTSADQTTCPGHDAADVNAIVCLSVGWYPFLERAAYCLSQCKMEETRAGVASFNCGKATRSTLKEGIPSDNA